ncbi:MAG: hypothetical protein H8E42_02625 [Nitrospinae bacterium]|nr:hypothetical protein [Nitrospinota bacterium]MBL7018958.1 hypothetical protein [Nitrospinaceae bacterium]
MLKPNRSRALTVILLLVIFASCKTLDHYYKTQEDLDLSIKAYNFEFESKAIDTSARFVHPANRAQYLAKSLEITKRLTFFEATILDIKFFNNGVPTSGGSKKGFDRAIVVIRYQAAVLPSTKLKTLMVEQEWVLYQDQWVTIPDLSMLLEQ